MRKKQKSLALLICLCCLVSGCSMQKKDMISELNFESSDTEITQKMRMHHFTTMDQKELPVADIVEKYLGVSFQEAESYRMEDTGDNYEYKKEGVRLSVAPLYGNPGEIYSLILRYLDGNAEAGYRYESLIRREETGTSVALYLEASLREHFPEEELDIMSREEVIRRCSIFADALGYDETTDISVYALGQKELQKAACDWNDEIQPGEDSYIGAPDPEAEAIYQEPEEYNTLRTWSKEDEAFLLIYRPKIDDIVIDWTGGDSLVIIYVPFSDKIVYVSGNYACKISDQQENAEVISEQEALSKLMAANGISKSDQLSIKLSQIVYSTNYEHFYHNNGRLAPCWRFEYRIQGYRQENDYTKTFIMDAVTEEVLYPNNR